MTKILEINKIDNGKYIHLKFFIVNKFLDIFHYFLAERNRSSESHTVDMGH